MDNQSLLVADSYLTAGNIHDITVDTVLQQKRSRTIDIGVALKKRDATSTLNPSAIIGNPNLGHIININTQLMETEISTSVNINAAIQQEYLHFVDTDTVLQKKRSHIFDVGSMLRKENKVHGIDLSVQLQGRDKISDIGVGSLLKQRDNSTQIDMSTVLSIEHSSTISLDTVLESEVATILDTDVLLKKWDKTTTIGISTVVENPDLDHLINTDTVLQDVDLPTAIGLNTITSKEVGKALGTDVLLKQRDKIQDISLDTSIITTDVSNSVNVSTVLSKKHSILFNINTVIREEDIIEPVGLDALLLKEKTDTLSMDTSLSQEYITIFNTDTCIINSNQTTDLNADVRLVYKRTTSINIDTVFPELQIFVNPPGVDDIDFYADEAIESMLEPEGQEDLTPIITVQNNTSTDKTINFKWETSLLSCIDIGISTQPETSFSNTTNTGTSYITVGTAPAGETIDIWMYGDFSGCTFGTTSSKSFTIQGVDI